MCNFLIYTGDNKFENVGVNALSLSEKIVVYLAHDFLDLGFSIYTDNWFTSKRLASYLLLYNTLLTSKVKPNRGIPLMVKTAQLARGQTMFARFDDMLCLNYFVKINVFMLRI